MNSSFDKIKTYFVPLLSIIVVVLLVPTVVMPQVKKLSENWKIVNQNGKRLDALETKATALEQIASAHDELDRNLSTAESALPIEKDVARLVRGVQNLAVGSGLEVRKVEIKPGKTATTSATPATTTDASATPPVNKDTVVSSKNDLIFDLTVRGSLEAFQSFLKSLEATKRLLILSSFKAASDSGSDYLFDVVVDAPFGPLPKPSQDQLAQAVAELSSDNKKLLNDLEGSAFKNVTNDPLPTGPTGVTDPFK